MARGPAREGAGEGLRRDRDVAGTDGGRGADRRGAPAPGAGVRHHGGDRARDVAAPRPVLLGAKEAIGGYAIIEAGDLDEALELARTLPVPDGKIEVRPVWDRRRIAAAIRLIERAAARGRFGPYQVEAAIAAVHCDARTWEQTDWPQLLERYTMLSALEARPWSPSAGRSSSATSPGQQRRFRRSTRSRARSGALLPVPRGARGTAARARPGARGGHHRRPGARADQEPGRAGPERAAPGRPAQPVTR